MITQEFDFSIDLMRFLFWEYDTSNVKPLMESLQTEITNNNETFWNDWIVNVFDLETANDFGVSVWAIILDLPILLESDPAVAKIAFGFGPERSNFGAVDNDSNFGQNSSGAALLTLDQKRRILRMRYRMLVATGNNIEFNSYSSILTEGYGLMWMGNTATNMQVEYAFNFTVPPWMQYALNTFDILPTPSGVEQIITY